MNRMPGAKIALSLLFITTMVRLQAEPRDVEDGTAVLGLDHG